jgi:diguanylate cyclase (GGDEF)-like protein/PAS domain S-box-containing protein
MGVQSEARACPTDRVPGFDAARPLLDALSQPVVVTGLDTSILYWNPAAADLYGFSAREALGQPIHMLLGTSRELNGTESLEAVIRRGHAWTGQLVGRSRSGKPLTVLVTLTPLGPENCRPVALIGTAVDVTAAAHDHHRLTEALALIEEKSRELRHQALHDFLTDLPNRALILDRTEQMLTRARRQHIPVTALFLDLDHFKDINDSLGRAAGDQLLKLVAARLRRALRPSDTIGRLSGDEFIVLAEGASLGAGPALIAERLLSVLHEPFMLSSRDGVSTPVSVTASIGIATGDRSLSEDLIRDADFALYQAKVGGRNRYELFVSEMRDSAEDRLALEADLKAAVGAGQFFLEYQPTFSLDDIATVGAEALLRWQHPTRGVLGPLEFISSLEESGLILPVGRWILLEACRQCSQWHAAGVPLTISVNVSARQLESDSFIDDVTDAITASGLPPSALVVEITESILMRDGEATIGRLKAIKAVGVRIAIDDFGTGYSSLSYLRQFPVDILKIDQSFISATGDHDGGDALLHTLVQLGKELGLETLAEGIDTEEQLQRLQRLQCDIGQGFLIAKPMSADAITEFVHSDRPGSAVIPTRVHSSGQRTARM